MKYRIFLCIALAFCIVGCDSIPQLAQSVGERSSGFAYIPLDPLRVEMKPGVGCEFDKNQNGDFLNLKEGFIYEDFIKSLPDNAVRVAIKEYDNKGNISYAGSSIGSKNSRYQVILDYIIVDSSNVIFYIPEEKTDTTSKKLTREIKSIVRIFDNNPTGYPRESAIEEIHKIQGNITIPVYVGVGLRLTADLQIIKGTLNLASLGGIAAGVEAGMASGSLVVQTLGVTGKQVSTSLPLPSELNQTTVQNAILSLGSIKAIIFDGITTLTPRVTGMYLPLQSGNEELVNKIVSELARRPIQWERPCIYISKK